MKKNKLLIGLTAILLASCGGTPASSQPTQGSNTEQTTQTTGKETTSQIDPTQTSQPTTITIPSTFTPGPHLIKVVYTYPDGTIISEVSEYIEGGEYYEFQSPTIEFMKPSQETIAGYSTEDTVIKVKYDYANVIVENVNPGSTFKPLYYNQSKGISFSFVLTNSTEKTDTLLTSKTNTIRTGQLTTKPSNGSYAAIFDNTQPMYSNGASYECLYGPEGVTYLVGISINPDKTIDIYKNGVLQASYMSMYKPVTYTSNGNKYTIVVADFVDNFVSSLQSNGFMVGTGSSDSFKISDLSVNYALTEETAKSYAAQYKIVQVLYLNDKNIELTDRRSAVSRKESFDYHIPSPEFGGYKPDKEFVEGTANENKLELVYMTQHRGEHITDSMKKNGQNILDKSNRSEWTNETTWFTIGEFHNDFNAEVNITNEGCKGTTDYSVGNINWRTALLIVRDKITKDRWVSRLDNYGWRDDVNGDGQKSIGTSRDQGVEYFQDRNTQMYNTYKNCEVNYSMVRVGQKLTVNVTIYPLEGSLAYKEFHTTFTLNGITQPDLEIYITSEFAKVTFNSIVY